MPRPTSTVLLTALAAALAVAGILLLRVTPAPAGATATHRPSATTLPLPAPTTPPPATSPTPTPQPSPPSPSSPTPPVTPTALTPAGPSGQQIDPPGDPATVGGIPPTAATTPEQHQATSAAETFMRAFARPPAGTDHATWWVGVAPLMTPQARLDYQGVNPTWIPYTTLRGPALIQPQADEPDSHLQTLIRVPTDAGDYLVALQQRGTQWLITRITPASTP